MAVDFEIKSFLWFQDPDAGQRGSDKIWGYVVIGDKTYNFWGRRSDAATEKKHLTFKHNPGRWSDWDLKDLARKKVAKGYREISTRHEDNQYPAIEAIYPNFIKSFQNQLMLAKLSDNIRNAGRFL